MTDTVKLFFELHINLLDENRLVEFLKLADRNLPTTDPHEVVTVLEAAGIPTTEALCERCHEQVTEGLMDWVKEHFSYGKVTMDLTQVLASYCALPMSAILLPTPALADYVYRNKADWEDLVEIYKDPRTQTLKVQYKKSS